MALDKVEGGLGKRAGVSVGRLKGERRGRLEMKPWWCGVGCAYMEMKTDNGVEED